MIEISYCERWWISEKKPIKPLDEKSAYLRHNKRQPYTAIISESGQLKYIVQLVDKLVSVSFMDKQVRKYLQYDFNQKQNGKVFLETAIYWEYDSDSDLETSTMIFGFQEDGHTVMERRDLKSNEVQERELFDSVEGNWEEYPEFGQYMSLCQEERYL